VFCGVGVRKLAKIERDRHMKTTDITTSTDEEDRLPAARESDEKKSHIIRGILQVGVAAAFMRGGGLIAQIFAGYLLTKSDFGLFAITLGFITFSVAALSALRPLFIERLTNGESTDRLWRFMMYLMTALAGLMMAFSGPLARALGEPDAQRILLAMAPTLPLQVAQVMGVARLASQLRFSDSSKILTASAMARHASLILFAFLGFGAFSLVLPLYVEAVLEGALLWRATGRPPALLGSVRGVLHRYGRTLPWLLLTAIALAASLSGDYLAIGFFETTEVVGLYFFGYSLSAALTQPFSMAATNVLVPSFASVKNMDRLRSSYLNAISVLLLVTGIAFGGLALVGGNLIDAIWSGRWNEAIVAMVLISAGTPFRILQPTCYSLLQARGLWKTHAILATFNAVFAIGGAIIGAMIGGLLEIALLVGIAGGIVGGIVAIIAGTHIGIAPTTTVRSLLRGSLPPVAGLIAAYGLYPVLLPPLGSSIIRALVFVVISVPLSAVLFQTQIRTIISSVRGRES
jgi:O-antigen/teichoic acid export membrane protein